jgi:host factor-I protein
MTPVEKNSRTPYRTNVEQMPSRFSGAKRFGQAVTQEIGMENKPAAQNIQDTFLNTARKERNNITIYLMSGVKLSGRIRSFDKYSVVLETNNQEQLIFKHAISTVAVGRAHGFSEKPRMVAGTGSAAATETSEPAPASGTEG